MAIDNLGYQDTPMVPGTEWHVHDGLRPQPRVVDPGTASTPERQGVPPSDAVVLFDGTDLSAWLGNEGAEPGWKVENGYMEVVPGTRILQTKEHFGDCQLHVEWMSPIEVSGEGQGRGNSGVFLMGMYEIQILDCYENQTYPDGTTAGIYGQFPPLVNACRKPGEWQTYDILWTAPRFDGDTLLSPARVTVLFNGVVVHNAVEPIGPTRHRTDPQYRPHPPVGPLVLQDHGNLNRFRNIWYRPLKGYDE